MSKTIIEFLEESFQDMAESAQAQHQVDKANFNAVKAEGNANIEEARANANPKVLQARMQVERDEQIAQARENPRSRKAH